MTYDSRAAIAAQENLCQTLGIVMMAPRSGICWSCRRSIYDKQMVPGFMGRPPYAIGVSVEQAAKSVITGCPHCHRAFD